MNSESLADVAIDEIKARNNPVIPLAIAGVVIAALFLFKDEIKQRLAPDHVEPVKPVPVAQFGLASAFASSETGKQDAAYVARLFECIADYSEQTDEFETKEQLLGTVRSVGQFGSMGQQWKINAKYPLITQTLKSQLELLQFNKPGELTSADKAAYVRLCRTIATECDFYAKN